MTKTTNKIWKKISFWNKVRIGLGAIGIGGEITLYLQEFYVGWNIVAAVITFIALLITLIFNDSNNDGVVDGLEDKEK